jgi:carboxyl-terminal processing protease
VDFLNKKKTAVKFIFVFAVLTGLLWLAQIYHRKLFASSFTETPTTSRTFANCYDDLLTSYLYPLKPKNLIAGAIKGMNVYLVQKRIPYHVSTPRLYRNSQLDLELFNSAFQQTYDKVRRKIKRKPEDKLMTAALNGMFNVTGDPFTVYMTPREFKSLFEMMNGGDFGGIGIYIGIAKVGNQLIVIEPIRGTPAWKAGLKPGDSILDINGKSTKGITLVEAQHRIRGPIGSSVILTIRHRHSSKETQVKIERALIHVPSVSYKLLDGNIAYVRLFDFGSSTGSELRKALRRLEAKGAKAYILDLRDNGGGEVTAAIDVCSQFLPEGDSVVSVHARYGRIETYRTKGGIQPDFPMAVLVNEFTASASEITSGALQDYKRAVVIGTRTYGKGSVQNVIPLPNRGAAKITIAHYETPAGHDVNKIGITPNIVIPMQGHAFGGVKDIQLQKAVHLLEREIKDHYRPHILSRSQLKEVSWKTILFHRAS